MTTKEILAEILAAIATVLLGSWYAVMLIREIRDRKRDRAELRRSARRAQ